MSNHLGKRERRAGKRHKRCNTSIAWQHPEKGSGSLTLKLGERKRKKVNLWKIAGIPF